MGDEGWATISVVVPVLNEARSLARMLARVQTAAGIEVIVVDGGSRDETAEIARSLGARVISAAPGRAQQMNLGARAAEGDLLLFLHGDTCLPAKFDHWVRQTLAQNNVVAGAFELRIDGAGWRLRLVEWGVNQRSRLLQLPYGDQAIFLKAAVFQAVGGFPELPIMEDFELIRRLRSMGRVAIAPAPVLTSGRRWQKLGVLKTTVINQLVILAYFLGISPTAIARWYRRGRC